MDASLKREGFFKDAMTMCHKLLPAIMWNLYGWFQAEEGLHAIGLRGPGGTDPVHIAASREDAESFFAQGTEPQLEVTYQPEQSCFADIGGVFKQKYSLADVLFLSVCPIKLPLSAVNIPGRRQAALESWFFPRPILHQAKYLLGLMVIGG